MCDHLVAVEVIAQVVCRLGEVRHEAVDVVLLARPIEPAPVERLVETLAEPIGVLLGPRQQVLDLLVAGTRLHVLRAGPTRGDTVCARQLMELNPERLPIALGRRVQGVGRHERVDDGRASQHVFGIGGTGLAIVRTILQALGRLLEVLDGSVDVVFRPGTVDPLAIDRAIETRAEGVDVRVQAGQQDVNLLIAGTSRLLLCRRHGTDTCERQHHGERTDL